MVRNASEHVRLEEEYAELCKEFTNLKYPKSYREAILRDIRKIEAQLGIEGNSYNGG